MERQGAFNQRTVAILVAVGVLSFVGAAYFMIFGEDLRTKRTVGPNSFSYSAIGHRGFVETLRRLEIPVLISRNDSTAKASRSSVLLVAEPIAQKRSDPRISKLLNAPAVLVVLPKRYGFKSATKQRWLGSANLLPTGAVDRTLRSIFWDARITRPKEAVVWKANRFDHLPDLEAPQLITTRRLRPIINSDEGMLLAEFRRGFRRIWILSDPDLISNHGIGVGDNAALAVSIIDALRGRDGVVIVDETIHGFRLDPSLWRTFFEFPYVIATIQAFAALIILLWAATGRFGAPSPVKRPFEAGKEALINNTARLLERGGHAKEIFKRYMDVTLKDVAHRVHAPRHLEGDALIDWLDRVGEAHGATTTFRSVRRRAERLSATSGADGSRTARAARSLHRWKQEMLHGPAGHSDGQQPTQRTGQKNRRRTGSRT